MASSLKDAIRQVKEQADIVAVVGRTVALHKAGNSYKGLCPFHKEKTPSFHVVPAKGIYHCFGCKAGGSVIDFVMHTERLEFIEALRQLAKETGIELPTASGYGGPRDEDEERRRALYSVNEFALTWFRDNLTSNRHPVASTYMEKRCITSDLAEKFALGAAMNEWAALKTAANMQGYSDDLLVEAGLCKRHEERGTIYDRLRNRLIFPIRDHLGRVIGFGGRRLSEDPNEAKYLNSPETPLYHKGRTLYGLDVSGKAITDTGYAIVTEGYMDAIMAHRFGFTQAIASLGTALTPEQSRLVKRYASRVVFLYDGDDAGRNAMLRAGEALLGAGIDTRVILLPKEDDPDTYLQREGAEALERLVHGAREYFDFALEIFAKSEDLATLAGQAELVEKTAPLLNAMPSDAQRAAGLNRLLTYLGTLPREAVMRTIQRRAAQQRPAHDNRPEAPELSGRAPVDPTERFALKLMLENQKALDVLRAELDVSWLSDDRLDPWIMFLLSHDGDAESLIAEAESTGTMPGDPSLLPEILADTHPLGDAVLAARQIAARLKRRHHKKVTRELIDAVREHYRNDPSGMPEGILRMIHEENRIAVKVEVPRSGL